MAAPWSSRVSRRSPVLRGVVRGAGCAEAPFASLEKLNAVLAAQLALVDNAAAMFGIPTDELFRLAVVLLVGGAFTGLFSGLLGVGGGLIIVPVLYHLFAAIGVDEAVRMHLCVGTSLAVIIPTSIRSFLSHRARGSVDVETLRMWILPILGGVIVGAAVAAFVSSEALKLIFGLFGTLFGSQMLLLGSKKIQMTENLPGRTAMSGYGFGIGMLASLIGIGGGGIVNLVYAVHGRTIHQSVGTGAGVGVLVSIPGAIGFMIGGWPEMAELPPLSIGYVSVIGALLIAPVSMLVAPLGVRIAHAFSRRQLEVALGLFMIILGGRFLFEILIDWAT